MDNIQYLFYFSSDELCLLETKRLGLPAHASMSDIYKWLIFFKSSGKFMPLSFINMIQEANYEYRSFAEAELKFDKLKAELNFQGKLNTLIREDPVVISPDLKEKTRSFLFGLV